MPNAKQTRRVTLASRETLMNILEALPGALFFVDDDATVVYANASAQAMTGGATREDLYGKLLWRCVPQLVSTSLYQAVRKTRQSQQPTEMEYISPITQTWLHVQLAPTAGGLMLQFHEVREPARRQEMVSQGERLSLDDLHTRIAILTPEGIVLDINEASLNDAQVRREEVIGKSLAEAPWWSFSLTSQEQFRAAISQAGTGEIVRFEALLRPREGIFLHFEIAITPHMDADHHIEYLVIAGIDITARKRVEREIHTLIDAIPQLVWTGRPDGYADSYNQRWRDYTGLTTEQAQGDGWVRMLHPDDRQRILALWQLAVRTGSPYEAEHRLCHGVSKDYRWFLAQAMPYKDAQGTILKYVGTCTDIEEQKRVEQQLKESREDWRVLAETVPHLVWTMLPDGRLDYTNQRCRDWAQEDSEHLRNYGWRQFVHPDDQERMFLLRQRALETGGLYENEYRLRNGQTGEYHWFLSRAYPVHDEAGQIIKWFGASTDIDGQKRTEEALRQSQAQVQALMASTIIGIYIAEEEEIIEANETFLRMTGYSRDDLQHGRLNRWHMTAPEYFAITRQAREQLDLHAYVTPYEKEYIGKDGSRLPVFVGGVATQLNPLQEIIFVLDNSARKELEQRKDDFISMASHELRNPLAAVKMQIQLVRKRLERQSHHEAATALSRVEGPLKQLERLIGELLDVSKIQAGRLEYVQETVHLNVLLREITNTMQHIYPSHTLVVGGAVQISLRADRDRLGQVFANLISNAIKYSPDAQTVEIDLSTSPETVTIRVHDHGLGIPREQHDKIFERFYRATGPKQKAIPGLGMGLYIVAEIVKRHGGAITVESTVGKGSTFTVTLPLKRDTLD